MIHHGDCLEVMAGMPESSVDSIVTDPPAGISFMSKDWDHDKGGRSQWVAWMTGVMSECLRVLKPGGYILCWAIPRTSHWTAWAIEDAGFIIRDRLIHCFASGFPKSKALLKPAYEDWWMARKPGPLRELAIDACRIGTTKDERDIIDKRSGRGDATEGWGHIGVRADGERFTSHDAGRWPANVLLTPTEDGRAIFDGDVEGVVGGGDAGRAGVAVNRNRDSGSGGYGGWDKGDGADVGYGDTGTYSRFFLIPKAARAEREPIIMPGARLEAPKPSSEVGITAEDISPDAVPARHNPVESAFSVICATCNRQRVNVPGAACQCDEPEWVRKAQKPRRNTHPTVKPLDLMRHLVRLVTPDGGTVLDPFLGSGTTAIAAEMEGFAWVGIEREAEYVAIAEARLQGVQKGLGLSA